MAQWTTADIPNQTGRSAVVTGAGGLGYETALALARADAEVILAGRNPARGAESVARVRAQVPEANIRFAELDLASRLAAEPPRTASSCSSAPTTLATSP